MSTFGRTPLPRPIPTLTTRLEGPADAVARNHDQRLRAVELSRLVTAKLIEGVVLVNGQFTTVAHGMGRRVVAFVSWPYVTFGTSGRISMQHDANPDPTRFVALTAAGWSGDITVDILVV